MSAYQLKAYRAYRDIYVAGRRDKSRATFILNMSPITYRRNLPHIHPENTPIFITFRLANSLPIDVLEQLKRERDAEHQKFSSKVDRYTADKKYFARYDEWLDRIKNTPRWLQ